MQLRDFVVKSLANLCYIPAMCGIVGLIGSADAAQEAFLGLTTLQHRGQDGAGILTYDATGFHRVKNLGLVDSVFTRENMTTLRGNLGVAHTRYSTAGGGEVINVQPFLLSYPFGLGMVHNGNIVNYREQREFLKKKMRRNVLTGSDTEVILNLLAENLAKTSESKPDEALSFDQICEGVANLVDYCHGSYSIVTLIAEHGLLAFRDPNGIRPLIWGKRKGDGLASGEEHMVASESVALNFNGYDVVRSIEPGEVLYIDMNGEVHTRVLSQRERRPCMFEWVYFASPESVIDGVPVYGSRINLGKNLAKLIRKEIENQRIDADIVVPVPESSRIASIALAEELGLPYREILIKNRYIKRTFILDSQKKRKQAVKLKLSPVKSEMKGKKVILVDDSIVRGTTSKQLIELVRQAGAEKVYFVSTCPPIQHPCFYGLDFPSGQELLAHGRNLEEIEAELDADKMVYIDQENLRNAIAGAGEDRRCENPCMACLDGKYPGDVSAGRAFGEARQTDRKEA